MLRPFGKRRMANTIRVLHVDDDPGVAELTASFLTRADDRFEVETVAGADAALERIDGSAVDCIVSDYDMPGRNGIEFLRAVRESYRTLPFILFTGKGSEEVASEAVSAGVTDYLQKGTGTEQYDLLANRITNAVSRNRARTNYRELFEKAEVGLAIAHHETGEIRDVNPAYADIVGHERDDVVGANPGEFTPEHAPHAEDDAVRQITGVVEDGPASFEWLHETAGTGTGFGLGIVAEVAEAHGWDVAVTDAAGGGARFEVSGVEVVDGTSQ